MTANDVIYTSTHVLTATMITLAAQCACNHAIMQLAWRV